MFDLWQKKLRLNYSKDVFDIVQFGSSVIEGKEPRDIDICVIFNKIAVKEQLIQSQKIKRQLEKISKMPLHMTSFDLYGFLDPSNFARESILFYGKSLISKKIFANRLGFTPKIQISYDLSNLKKRDKVKFNYLLRGKSGNYGLLKKHGGKLLNPGLIEIEPGFDELFINHIKRITSKFKIRKVMVM